jgi:hypothetical protein
MKLVEELRLLEVDHEPSGWPAVQMRQISALCDEVDRSVLCVWMERNMLECYQGIAQSAEADAERNDLMRQLGSSANGDHVLVAVIRNGCAVYCALNRISDGGKRLTARFDLGNLDIRMQAHDV